MCLAIYINAFPPFLSATQFLQVLIQVQTYQNVGYSCYLTTPWPKARKNLNLRSKFWIFPGLRPRGGHFIFCRCFFFAQYDNLEGAHSLWRFLGQISSFSRYFLETLTEMGSIHWVGVQTWLQSSHGKVRGDDTLEGAHSLSRFFGTNLLLFVSLFGNTYIDGFYTLGRCTNLSVKQPCR